MKFYDYNLTLWENILNSVIALGIAGAVCLVVLLIKRIIDKIKEKNVDK